MALISSRTVGGRCPVCGGQHAACGEPSAAVPADQMVEVAAVSGPLKRYRVVTESGAETVMKLNEQDAERLGGEPVEPAETVVELPEPEPEEPVENKARTTTPGRGRAARTKGGGGGG